MPLFLVERTFAEELESATVDSEGIRLANENVGVEWLYSFLSADKRKTYCLYEAPSAEAIRRAAAMAGLPADEIVALSARINTDASFVPIPVA